VTTAPEEPDLSPEPAEAPDPEHEPDGEPRFAPEGDDTPEVPMPTEEGTDG